MHQQQHPSGGADRRPVTETENTQQFTENLLRKFVEAEVQPRLLRAAHGGYLEASITHPLTEKMQSLHCSQPWLAYWVLQASDLLGVTRQLFSLVPPKTIAQFLLRCVSEDAPLPEHDAKQLHLFEGVEKGDDEPPHIANQKRIAFCGGHGQLPHMATSYAAVSALCILSTESHIRAIDRHAMSRWLLSMRNRDGSFRMHNGGEADVRASYCAAVITHLLGLDQQSIIGGNVGAYVASCQTYEGGFACSHLSPEAHGGYTQCGLAALLLTQSFHLLDFQRCKRWLCERQMSYEGGFNGRTNKLVDSCYCHWIGSSHAMLRIGEAHNNVVYRPAHQAAGGGAGGTMRMTATDVLLMDFGQLVDAKSITMDEAVMAAGESAKKLQRERTDAFLFAAPSSCATSGGGTAGSTAEVDHAHQKQEERVQEDEEEAFEDLPGDLSDEAGVLYLNQRRMQDYVLRCCQEPKRGGLMDKPEHPNDFYHTCYSLSGVSSVQDSFFAYHAASSPCATAAASNAASRQCSSFYKTCQAKGWVPAMSAGAGHGAVVGRCDAERAAVLRPNNPIFNITKDRVLFALRLFGGKTFVS